MGPPALRARIREDDTATAFALIASLGREIEDALRKPICKRFGVQRAQ